MTVVENTLGAASIGFNVACCLFGVLTTQVFIYFKRFCLDKPVYKFLVCYCHRLFCLGSKYFDLYMEGFHTLVNRLPNQIIQCCADTLQGAGVTGSSTYWIFDILLQHKVRFMGSFTPQQLNTFFRQFGHLEVLLAGSLVW